MGADVGESIETRIAMWLGGNRLEAEHYTLQARSDLRLECIPGQRGQRDRIRVDVRHQSRQCLKECAVGTANSNIGQWSDGP